MCRILPLVILVVGSSGCQDPTPKWVGEWLGHNDGLVAPELKRKDPVLAGNLTRVHLTLRSDRTFELIRAGLPNEGNYSISKSNATLTITKIMGKQVSGMPDEVKKQNAPIQLTLQDPNTIIMSDPADFGRNPITLKRQESD